MSLLGILLGNTIRDAHDGVLKTAAAAAPEAFAQAGIDEARQRAAALADKAAHASTAAEQSRREADAAKAQVAKYTAVVEKLQASDPATAEEAMKKAEQLQPHADQLEQQAKDDDAFAEEMKTAAITATQHVETMQDHLKNAVHEQALAAQRAEAEQQHLHDRQEAAGLIHGLDSQNLALDTLQANARKAQEAAQAAHLQSEALGGASGSSKLDAALAEVDKPATGGSLQERLAAMKAHNT